MVGLPVRLMLSKSLCCCATVLAPVTNNSVDAPGVTATPAPAAVFTVKEKAPAVPLTTWKRACNVGTTMVRLPVRVPNRLSVPVPA
ncbi:hypothetical protein D3C87_1363750 [compost metagenome]